MNRHSGLIANLPDCLLFLCQSVLSHPPLFIDELFPLDLLPVEAASYFTVAIILKVRQGQGFHRRAAAAPIAVSIPRGILGHSWDTDTDTDGNLQP